MVLSSAVAYLFGFNRLKVSQFRTLRQRGLQPQPNESPSLRSLYAHFIVTVYIKMIVVVALNNGAIGCWLIEVLIAHGALS